MCSILLIWILYCTTGSWLQLEFSFKIKYWEIYTININSLVRKKQAHIILF